MKEQKGKPPYEKCLAHSMTTWKAIQAETSVWTSTHTKKDTWYQPTDLGEERLFVPEVRGTLNVCCSLILKYCICTYSLIKRLNIRILFD